MTAEERVQQIMNAAALPEHFKLHSGEPLAEALLAALASARRDALSDAVTAIWAAKDKHAVISGEMLDMVREIVAAVKALAKAPDNE